MKPEHLALLFYVASARPIGVDLVPGIDVAPGRLVASPRRLVASTPGSSCIFGYELGSNAYGEACSECLAPAAWGNCTDWTDCDGSYQ